jgi:hypothetical protein
MLLSRLPTLLFTAVLLSSAVEAGLFYKNSPVKMLDAKSFKKAMKENVRREPVWNAVVLNPHQRMFLSTWME